MPIPNRVPFQRDLHHQRPPGHVSREDRVLDVLWDCPWSSPGNISSWSAIDLADVYDILVTLETDLLVVGADLGSIRPVQARYILHQRGVRHQMVPNGHRRGRPLEWQVTESGTERLLGSLPMLEETYEVTPRLFDSTAAEPLILTPGWDPGNPDIRFLGKVTLKWFKWLLRDRIHAVACYRCEREDIGRVIEILVPYVWSGCFLQQAHRRRDLRDASRYVKAPLHGSCGDPGVVMISRDGFAGLRAGSGLARNVTPAVLDANGNVINPLPPVPPDWRLIGGHGSPNEVGEPEAAAESAQDDPAMAHYRGVRHTRIFWWVEQFPGCTTGQLARTFRMSRSAVIEIADQMARGDLLVKLDGGWYLGEGGIKAVAERDRVSDKRVRRRFGAYLNSDGKYRRLQQRHDRTVGDVAALFHLAGIPVAAGWRWEVILRKSQVRPDLWVCIEIGRGMGMWHPVEVELSAKSNYRVSKKLRPYWAALDQHKPFPLLVVVGTEDGASTFRKLGSDLPILVTTVRQIKNHLIKRPTTEGVEYGDRAAYYKRAFWGPDTVWRAQGDPVDVDALKAAVRHGGIKQPLGEKIADSVGPESEQETRRQDHIFDPMELFLGGFRNSFAGSSP